jgi:hypothetical protein
MASLIAHQRIRQPRQQLQRLPRPARCCVAFRSPILRVRQGLTDRHARITQFCTQAAQGKRPFKWRFNPRFTLSDFN